MNQIAASILATLAIAAVNTVSAQQADGACDTPVNMVILSIVHDVERYQAYRTSLGELGTLKTFGGRVIAVGKRLEAEPEVFEGDWPRDRHSFVIQFPCAEAAHRFWNSDAYQNVHLPLRVGARQFNVALFPTVPLSE